MIYFIKNTWKKLFLIKFLNEPVWRQRHKHNNKPVVPLRTLSLETQQVVSSTLASAPVVPAEPLRTNIPNMLTNTYTASTGTVRPLSHQDSNILHLPPGTGRTHNARKRQETRLRHAGHVVDEPHARTLRLTEVNHPIDTADHTASSEMFSADTGMPLPPASMSHPSHRDDSTLESQPTEQPLPAAKHGSTRRKRKRLTRQTQEAEPLAAGCPYAVGEVGN